jgi:hypothetical protein
MNGDELDAAVDLLDLMAELLAGVKIAYYDDDQWQDSVARLAAVRSHAMTLRDELRIDAEYPSLTDRPLFDLRKHAQKLREKLAKPDVMAP